MQSRIWSIVLLTASLWLCSPYCCAATGSSDRDSEPGESLRAAVAANFREPFAILSKLYEQSHSDTVQGIFGSSGLLSAQIQQGAPFDLFFSADSKRPRDLVMSGHASGTPFTYARGRLALWFPDGFPDGIPEGIPDGNPDRADLKIGVAGRFVLANPELAPYGRAARECLQTLRLWKQARERAVYGNNVSQTYHFISSGGVPAGFIALSQAIAQKLPDTQLWLAPTSCHMPIEQQAVELRSAKPEAVQRFAQFIVSAEAQSIIESLGYSNPLDEHF